MGRACAALALLGCAGLAFRIVSRHTGFVALIPSIPAFLFWFAVGMAFALSNAWLAGRGEHPRLVRLVTDRPGLCWALAAALYLAFCLAPGAPAQLSARTAGSDAVEHVVYATIAALVMAPAVFGEGAGGLPRRILASRALTKVGAVSYGIFLWHYPLLAALPRLGLDRLVPGSRFCSALLAIVPVSLACGWLSHRCVELPALRLGRGPS